MKIGTESVINALRGLGTASAGELRTHLAGASGDLNKTLSNLIQRKLVVRVNEDGRLAYKLTHAGKVWTPTGPGRNAASRPEAAPRDAEPADGGAAALQTALALRIERDEIADKLKNAEALAAKLQTLLDSSRHEAEAMRHQLSQQCDSAPDMDTVPLHELLQAVGLYLDDGVSITVYPGAAGAVLHAFGKEFHVLANEAEKTLQAAAHLHLMEVSI